MQSCEDYKGIYEERQRRRRSLTFQRSFSPQCVPLCQCQSSLEDFDNNWIYGCHCGEGPSMPKIWLWEKDELNEDTEISLSEENRVIAFHNDFSHGTAICRGNTLLLDGVHFWEIKILSPVYGTDIMIGVANKSFRLNQYQNAFKSALGADAISWGLSYRGEIYHNNQWQDYSPSFKRKTIVGCLLDILHGTLSFYIDRKPMGIAFRNIVVGDGLYPMVSSTAARIGVRLIRAQTTPMTLEYLACRKINDLVKSDPSLINALSFPPGLKNALSIKMPWLLDSPVKSSRINYGQTSTSVVDAASYNEEIISISKINSPQTPISMLTSPLIDSYSLYDFTQPISSSSNIYSNSICDAESQVDDGPPHGESSSESILSLKRKNSCHPEEHCDEQMQSKIRRDD